MLEARESRILFPMGHTELGDQSILIRIIFLLSNGKSIASPFPGPSQLGRGRFGPSLTFYLYLDLLVTF